MTTDVAIIAIEADLDPARLLAQELRAQGVDADAVMADAAEEVARSALALVFFTTAAALESATWRGLAAISVAERYSAVLAAVSGKIDEAALDRVLPTDNIVAADAPKLLRVLAKELGVAPSDSELDGAELADEAPAGGMRKAASPPRESPLPGGALDALEDGVFAGDGDSTAEGAVRRERSAPPAPIPAPKPAPKPAPTPAPMPASGAGDRQEAAAPPLQSAKLFENAPRRMRLNRRHEITVRVSPNEGAETGMPGKVTAHAIVATQVMTVTLDDPDFAFAIRPLTPSTQWIDRGLIEQLGFLGAAASAEWRWSVEPIKTGAHRLSISASARVTDAQGVSADAGLPPQVVQVDVRIAPSQLAARVARWAAVALAAAVVGHFGTEILNAASALLG